MSLLRAERISAGYGRIDAVRGVSLSVDEGEVVAILGANGAGKSTLLRCIAGLMKPASGVVELDGRRIDGRPAHRVAALGVALVPEGRGIFPELTIRETLEMGAYLVDDAAERTRRLDSVHDIFPVLAERSAQRAGTLSGGEQQQLAIARALMSQPRLLLLDELSLGLAPRIVARLFELLREINRRGVTLLVVEQQIGRALHVAQRAYVMEKGEIVLAGSSDEVAAHPLLREAYLTAAGGERVAAIDPETDEKVLVPMRVSLKRRLQAHARIHGDGRVGPHVARAIELYLDNYAREGGGNGAGTLPGDAEVEVTA
jgi:branched-chain amino acid transport system ATP-binding protein